MGPKRKICDDEINKCNDEHNKLNRDNRNCTYRTDDVPGNLYTRTIKNNDSSDDSYDNRCNTSASNRNKYINSNNNIFGEYQQNRRRQGRKMKKKKSIFRKFLSFLAVPSDRDKHQALRRNNRSKNLLSNNSSHSQLGLRTVNKDNQQQNRSRQSQEFIKKEELNRKNMNRGNNNLIEDEQRISENDNKKKGEISKQLPYESIKSEKRDQQQYQPKEVKPNKKENNKDLYEENMLSQVRQAAKEEKPVQEYMKNKEVSKPNTNNPLKKGVYDTQNENQYQNGKDKSDKPYTPKKQNFQSGEAENTKRKRILNKERSGSRLHFRYSDTQTNNRDEIAIKPRQGKFIEEHINRPNNDSMEIEKPQLDRQGKQNQRNVSNEKFITPNNITETSKPQEIRQDVREKQGKQNQGKVSNEKYITPNNIIETSKPQEIRQDVREKQGKQNQGNVSNEKFITPNNIIETSKPQEIRQDVREKQGKQKQGNVPTEKIIRPNNTLESPIRENPNQGKIINEERPGDFFESTKSQPNRQEIREKESKETGTNEVQFRNLLDKPKHLRDNPIESPIKGKSDSTRDPKETTANDSFVSSSTNGCCGLYFCSIPTDIPKNNKTKKECYEKKKNVEEYKASLKRRRMNAEEFGQSAATSSSKPMETNAQRGYRKDESTDRNLKEATICSSFHCCSIPTDLSTNKEKNNNIGQNKSNVNKSEVPVNAKSIPIVSKPNILDEEGQSKQKEGRADNEKPPESRIVKKYYNDENDINETNPGCCCAPHCCSIPTDKYDKKTTAKGNSEKQYTKQATDVRKPDDVKENPKHANVNNERKPELKTVKDRTHVIDENESYEGMSCGHCCAIPNDYTKPDRKQIYKAQNATDQYKESDSKQIGSKQVAKDEQKQIQPVKRQRKENSENVASSFSCTHFCSIPSDYVKPDKKK